MNLITTFKSDPNNRILLKIHLKLILTVLTGIILPKFFLGDTALMYIKALLFMWTFLVYILVDSKFSVYIYVAPLNFILIFIWAEFFINDLAYSSTGAKSNTFRKVR